MEDAASAYSVPMAVRWADLDPNGHVRHSVYYDWGAMVRLTFLEQHGVGVAWMTTHGIGPVLFREEARFVRELRFGDELRMDLQLAASSPEARKWRMRHRLFRGADLAATLEIDGAWLDLRARKITAPPTEMVRAFDQVSRSDDFTVLTSSPLPSSPLPGSPRTG
jgi:acyl-CoA thioester hydrolase